MDETRGSRTDKANILVVNVEAVAREVVRRLREGGRYSVQR